jgi:hypothetical protein
MRRRGQVATSRAGVARSDSLAGWRARQDALDTVQHVGDMTHAATERLASRRDSTVPRRRRGDDPTRRPPATRSSVIELPRMPTSTNGRMSAKPRRCRSGRSSPPTRCWPGRSEPTSPTSGSETAVRQPKGLGAPALLPGRSPACVAARVPVALTVAGDWTRRPRGGGAARLRTAGRPSAGGDPRVSSDDSGTRPALGAWWSRNANHRVTRALHAAQAGRSADSAQSGRRRGLAACAWRRGGGGGAARSLRAAAMPGSPGRPTTARHPERRNAWCSAAVGPLAEPRPLGKAATAAVDGAGVSAARCDAQPHAKSGRAPAARQAGGARVTARRGKNRCAGARRAVFAGWRDCDGQAPRRAGRPLIAAAAEPGSCWSSPSTGRLAHDHGPNLVVPRRARPASAPIAGQGGAGIWRAAVNFKPFGWLHQIET